MVVGVNKDNDDDDDTNDDTDDDSLVVDGVVGTNVDNIFNGKMCFLNAISLVFCFKLCFVNFAKDIANSTDAGVVSFDVAKNIKQTNKNMNEHI